MQGCSKNKKEETSSTNDMISSTATKKASTSKIDENEFTLTDLKNNKYIVKKELDNYNIEAEKGKVLIFDLFATWCPPCQAEASHLSSLQTKFPNDLKIIGVTIEENLSNDKLLHFRQANKADYTLVNSPENSRLIRAMATSIKIGNRFPIPLMIMYKDGKYITHYVGAVQEEFIESDIKKALGK